jgi:POT family proton-dependent oligopeptide transporter
VCNFAAAILRNRIGWGAAFSAAGIGLIIGLIWLAFNLKHVKHYDVKKPMQPATCLFQESSVLFFLPMIVFGIIAGSFQEILWL